MLHNKSLKLFFSLHLTISTALDGPWRSLICVAWEYKNDHRHLKRNTI